VANGKRCRWWLRHWARRAAAANRPWLSAAGGARTTFHSCGDGSEKGDDDDEVREDKDEDGKVAGTGNDPEEDETAEVVAFTARCEWSIKSATLCVRSARAALAAVVSTPAMSATAARDEHCTAHGVDDDDDDDRDNDDDDDDDDDDNDEKDDDDGDDDDDDDDNDNDNDDDDREEDVDASAEEDEASAFVSTAALSCDWAASEANAS
jgi:hypothetical protein